MNKRQYAGVGMLCLSACSIQGESADTAESYALYETSNHTDALYLIEDQFVFHQSMVPSEDWDDFLREIVVPIPEDQYGCLRLDPLIIPKNITSPRCEDVSMTTREEGAKTMVTSSCDLRGQMCQVQTYDADGALLEFQFSPDDPSSEPYTHRTGPRLITGE